MDTEAVHAWPGVSLGSVSRYKYMGVWGVHGIKECRGWFQELPPDKDVCVHVCDCDKARCPVLHVACNSGFPSITSNAPSLRCPLTTLILWPCFLHIPQLNYVFCSSVSCFSPSRPRLPLGFSCVFNILSLYFHHPVSPITPVLITLYFNTGIPFWLWSVHGALPRRPCRSCDLWLL